MAQLPLIGIVGVCASGKSTLAGALEARGFRARQIAQEHSGVPALWQRLSKADVLIYLDASIGTVRQRLANPSWPEWLFLAQQSRLAHARENCDVFIDTDMLGVSEVLEQVLAFLTDLGVPARESLPPAEPF